LLAARVRFGFQRLDSIQETSPVQDFIDCFSEVSDPRGENIRHDLHEILLIALCTMLCGGEDCSDMVEFGHAKRPFLRQFLRLKHGIPSHDTFSRVFRLLDPEPFHACFVRFMERFAQGLEGVVAIDGKTLLTGSEAGVQAALKAGAGETTRDMFSFVGNNHVVLGFSSPALVGLSAGIPEPSEGSPGFALSPFVTAVKGKILGASIGMNFSNDLDLTISLQLTEEDAAKAAAAGLNQGVALAKQMGPLLAGGAPPELGPGLQGLLSSLAAGGRGDNVTLTKNENL